MVVHSLRKALAALALLAGLGIAVGVPATAAASTGDFHARVFQAPYAPQP